MNEKIILIGAIGAIILYYNYKPTVESTTVPTVESTTVPTVESTTVPTVESTTIPTVESTFKPIIAEEKKIGRSTGIPAVKPTFTTEKNIPDPGINYVIPTKNKKYIFPERLNKDELDEIFDGDD